MKINGEYLLLKPLSQEFDTSLFIPDKRLENKAEVLAVGNKVGDIKVGDTVFFNKFAVHEVEEGVIIHRNAVTVGFSNED